MTLKLHGMRMSNYYKMVKTALVEKGLDFEEVHQMPTQKDDAWLARSPMGKMPALETEHGSLAETMAILEFLEELQPEPTLLPGDAYQRARIRQIANHAINYVDLAMRPGLPAAAFGAPKNEAVSAAVGKSTPRGLVAMGRIAVFDPWIAGSEFSLADIVVANCIPLAAMVVKELCEEDLTASLPEGGAQWLARVQAREAVRKVEADKAA